MSLRHSIVNAPKWMKAGQLVRLGVDNIPNDMWDTFENMVFFAGDIEAKYLKTQDAMLSTRFGHKLYCDLEFRVWKLGAWSTTRIDALEKMNKNQRSYWLTERHEGPNYCPGCGKSVRGILGKDDDCVHCSVWWCNDCLIRNKRKYK